MNRLKRVLGVALLAGTLAVLLASSTQTSTAPNVNLTTHGRITRDEVWRGEVHVIGDIVVNEGVILTIEPGTRVLIAANSDVENLFGKVNPDNMRRGLNMTERGHPMIFLGEPWLDHGNHISILVLGTLYAVGTPNQLITITSDSPNPSRYDWLGLEMWNGTMGYVVMEHYRKFDPRNSAVVSDSVFRHVGGCAICFGPNPDAQEEVHGVVIERNTLSDAGHELIDNPWDVVIRDNHLGPNPSTVNPGGYEWGGVGVTLGGGAPQIVGNTIEDRDIGVCLLPIPRATPIDVWISQLCRDNTFTNDRHAIRAERSWRACPAAEASTSEDEPSPGGDEHP